MSSVDLAYYSFRTGTVTMRSSEQRLAMGPCVLVELNFASLCR
jgi:hypothetical protein